MLTVYLARHGQTEENLAHIFQGHLPGRLTETGKTQAKELGERLKDIHFDAIVSSDLQRVVDTVRLAFGDCSIPWEANPLFREIGWGSWTGLPIDSVDKSHIPSDAESREQLYERAERCVSYLREHYDGKTILVVAHGLINRSIRAVIEDVPVDQLTKIPHMSNGDVIRLEIA